MENRKRSSTLKDLHRTEGSKEFENLWRAEPNLTSVVKFGVEPSHLTMMPQRTRT